MTKVFTPREAAETLQVSYKTVIAYIHQGRLKAVVVSDPKRGPQGRRYRITQEAIDSFLDEPQARHSMVMVIPKRVSGHVSYL